jgi:hypothetical protein
MGVDMGKSVEFVRSVCDRFWLFTIAAIALGVIGIIVGSVVINGSMPKDAGELMTAAVTGLLMIVQKVIEAQQQRRMSDQLHQSSPIDTTPQSAAEGARETADAAEKKATRIEGQAERSAD